MVGDSLNNLSAFNKLKPSDLPASLEEWVLANLEDDLEDIVKYGAYDHLDDKTIDVLHDTYEKEIWQILAQRGQKQGKSALEVLRAFCAKDAFLAEIFNDCSDVSLKPLLVFYGVEKIAFKYYA